MFITINDNGKVAQVLNHSVDGALEVSDDAAQIILATKRVKTPPRPEPLPGVYYNLDDEGNPVKQTNTAKPTMPVPTFPERSTAHSTRLWW